VRSFVESDDRESIEARWSQFGHEKLERLVNRTSGWREELDSQNKIDTDNNAGAIGPGTCCPAQPGRRVEVIRVEEGKYRVESSCCE